MSKQNNNPDLNKRLRDLEQRIETLERIEKAERKRKAKLFREFNGKVGRFSKKKI